VRFEIDAAIPQKSVWTVVDVSTGSFSVSAPDGFAPSITSLPSNALGRGTNGVLNRLSKAGDYFDILVVQPGTGAWSVTVGDGGASDADGSQDGKVSADLGAMTSIGPPVAPPKRFDAGDVLLVIDSKTFEVSTLVISSANLTEAQNAF
jgi:hypothetical protein